MTHDEFLARWTALRDELDQQIRQLRQVRARLDQDDDTGALGVRQPVTPRGPAPRPGAIAVKPPRD